MYPQAPGLCVCMCSACLVHRHPGARDRLVAAREFTYLLFVCICVCGVGGCVDIRTISGHKAAITSLDFHLYGDILASGSMDTNLKVRAWVGWGTGHTTRGRLTQVGHFLGPETVILMMRERETLMTHRI